MDDNIFDFRLNTDSEISINDSGSCKSIITDSSNDGINRLNDFITIILFKKTHNGKRVQKNPIYFRQLVNLNSA